MPREKHYILLYQDHFVGSLWATSVETDPVTGAAWFYRGRKIIARLDPNNSANYRLSPPEWNSVTSDVFHKKEPIAAAGPCEAAEGIANPSAISPVRSTQKEGKS